MCSLLIIKPAQTYELKDLKDTRFLELTMYVYTV